MNMSFLGLFSFTAPYLPWVLLIFSVMLGSSPVVDLLGMAAGRGPGRSTTVPCLFAHIVPVHTCHILLPGLTVPRTQSG